MKIRCHSWIGHTIGHNEFVVNSLEGAIFGIKAMGRPRNRRHSWIQHTIGHNEFVVNILEGAIFGEKRPWEDLEIDTTHG